MATNVVEFVLDLPKALKRNNRLVLLTLATYADRNGGSIFPKLETLARRTALHKRQVQRILATLQRQGYLLEESPPRQHFPRTYRIRLESTASPRDDIHMSPLKSANASSPEVTSPAFRHDSCDVRGDKFDSSGDRAMSPDPLIDPSLDLLIPKNSGADATRDTLTNALTNKESYPVLEKLAHEVIAAEPEQAWPDRCAALKTMAARLEIPYDSDVIGRALCSADWQRKHPRAGRIGT